MLDVSVRADILSLQCAARDELGLAAIYISHDLALIRYVCERTLMMYLGRVVEQGPTAELIADPLHPYTRALVAAVPVPKVDQGRAPLPVRSALSHTRLEGTGCPLRDRCPHAFGRCGAETPPLREIAPSGRPSFGGCMILRNHGVGLPFVIRRSYIAATQWVIGDPIREMWDDLCHATGAKPRGGET